MGPPPSFASRFGSLVARVAFAAVCLLFVAGAARAPIEFGLSPWVGVVTMLLATLACVALAGLRRYPLTANGVERRVDRTTFREGAERCGACGELTGQGLRSRYARQWVLFGVPLYTIDWGENAYCPDCVDPATLAVESTAGDPPGGDRHDGSSGREEGSVAELEG